MPHSIRGAKGEFGATIIAILAAAIVVVAVLMVPSMAAAKRSPPTHMMRSNSGVSRATLYRYLTQDDAA